MRTNPNDLLSCGLVFSESYERDAKEIIHAGLTKREHFAAMAMQGILSGRQYVLNDAKAEWTAGAAVECADALIEELNKRG